MNCNRPIPNLPCEASVVWIAYGVPQPHAVAVMFKKCRLDVLSLFYERTRLVSELDRVA